MRRIYLTTLLTALALIAAFVAYYAPWRAEGEIESLKVGFIYKNDESTPYTYNFILAQNSMAKEYGDRVEILSFNNVGDNSTEEPLRTLLRKGCRIVFVNSYSPQVRELAPEYPDVQFCQISEFDSHGMDLPANYHTFNGAIYEGRYVSGVVAGLKLREMIDRGALAPEEALVGYVGAFGTPDVISGYTAFLLGVRSVAPEATMRVRYTGMWSNCTLEKACARKLLDEGCVIIGQHTNTIGPALACEEVAARREVYHVGYNAGMCDIAPTSALVSTRINWAPYITGAVGAVLADRPIEKAVAGHANSRDLCAGFDEGWVTMVDVNHQLCAPGTQAYIDNIIEGLRRGSIQVFKGDYTGVNPDDASDTCDLRQGYAENARSSFPSFHYILDGVVTVEQ